MRLNNYLFKSLKKRGTSGTNDKFVFFFFSCVLDCMTELSMQKLFLCVIYVLFFFFFFVDFLLKNESSVCDMCRERRDK